MAQAEVKDKSGMKSGEVRKKDDVTVYGTEKSAMTTGKPYVVHRALADKLIANGMATDKAPTDNAKKEAK